jgi:hypothetical protein
MIKTYSSLSLFFLLVSISLTAQNSRLEIQKKREQSKANLFIPPTFPEDSMIHLNLKSIDIIPPYNFKNAKQEKKYDQLTEDVEKTYPLSLVVGSELRLVNSELDSIYTDPKQRKAYIKWYQDYVRRTYMDSLKSLNVRQGKLLLKLIHRETGHTPYELIKEYRGWLNAIFWQSMAFTFGANLKSDYDPEDDSMIEHIIRRYNAGDFE